MAAQNDNQRPHRAEDGDDPHAYANDKDWKQKRKKWQQQHAAVHKVSAHAQDVKRMDERRTRKKIRGSGGGSHSSGAQVRLPQTHNG